MSQDVVERAGDDFVFRKLDTIRVKGKLEPVSIFELVGFKTDVSIQHDILNTYAK